MDICLHEVPLWVPADVSKVIMMVGNQWMLVVVEYHMLSTDCSEESCGLDNSLNRFTLPDFSLGYHFLNRIEGELSVNYLDNLESNGRDESRFFMLLLQEVYSYFSRFHMFGMLRPTLSNMFAPTHPNVQQILICSHTYARGMSCENFTTTYTLPSLQFPRI